MMVGVIGQELAGLTTPWVEDKGIKVIIIAEMTVTIDIQEFKKEGLETEKERWE
jgi:hypothetical protein